ncbi:MAG: glycosyltransferase family 2 protein [Phycisphaerales bacterium]
MKIELSIIIVNWNGSEITKQCLTSIYEQTRQISFEVIVVDNGSSDSSCEMIEKYFPQVRIIANRENRGFAAANNQGILEAKGDFLLLLNNDTIILDHALEKIIAVAKETPQAGVLGCKVLNADMTQQSSCFRFPSLLNLTLAAMHLDTFFPKHNFFGRERYAKVNWNKITEVDVVSGCFMLVRREAYEKTGVLDERFFMYAEETDWCLRFRQNGWKVLYAPYGEIIHLGGASSKKNKGPMALQLKGSILLFIKKHRSRLSYSTACLIVSLYFILRAFFLFNANCCKGSFLSLLGADYLCLKK